MHEANSLLEIALIGAVSSSLTIGMAGFVTAKIRDYYYYLAKRSGKLAFGSLPG
jgi:hypothetical protein